MEVLEATVTVTLPFVLVSFLGFCVRVILITLPAALVVTVLLTPALLLFSALSIVLTVTVYAVSASSPVTI